MYCSSVTYCKREPKQMADQHKYFMEKIVDVQPGLNILKNFLKRSLVEILIYYKLSAISL
jgi:hypothetical protein